MRASSGKWKRLNHSDRQVLSLVTTTVLLCTALSHTFHKVLSSRVKIDFFRLLWLGLCPRIKSSWGLLLHLSTGCKKGIHSFFHLSLNRKHYTYICISHILKNSRPGFSILYYRYIHSITPSICSAKRIVQKYSNYATICGFDRRKQIIWT